MEADINAIIAELELEDTLDLEAYVNQVRAQHKALRQALQKIVIHINVQNSWAQYDKECPHQ